MTRSGTPGFVLLLPDLSSLQLQIELRAGQTTQEGWLLEDIAPALGLSNSWLVLFLHLATGGGGWGGEGELPSRGAIFMLRGTIHWPFVCLLFASE